MLKDLVISSRSYRSFDDNYSITYEELYDMIDTARFVPSTVNKQALRYKIVNDNNICVQIFDTLRWAGLLKGKGTPAEGKRPTAYIFILCDKSVAELPVDVGIAAQTIMLFAAEKGYGGCIIGSIERNKVSEILDIDTEKYSIELCLAIGKPSQNVVIKDINIGDDTAYYHDESDNHIVPKIITEDLII